MKKNKIIRLYTNGIFTVEDVNDELDAGWNIQAAVPVGNHDAVDYILVKEIPDENVKTQDNDATVVKDYNRLKNEAEAITRQLHTALEDMDKEYKRKYFLWKFIKEAYERSKANDNKWWANVSCYFNVSKFPEIFETYDVDDAAEIIQKYYTEED